PCKTSWGASSRETCTSTSTRPASPAARSAGRSCRGLSVGGPTLRRTAQESRPTGSLPLTFAQIGRGSLTIPFAFSFSQEFPLSTTRLSRRPRHRLTQLCLEPLEDRTLMSTYALTDLGSLIGPGARAYDINDAGQVVGSVNGRAFLYGDGVLTDLGTLGGLTSQANSITNWGGVVGTSDGTGFFWYGGVMYDLGLGGQSSVAAINDWGQIVGTRNGSAFLWQGGVLTDLGNLGGPGGSSALGVNNAGQVVGTASSTAPGYFGLGTTDQAFVWRDGVMTSLGGLFSSANAVNNNG